MESRASRIMSISYVAILFLSISVPLSSPGQTGYPNAMDSMFNQWVDGQPWWMTLLLLPAIVLGAVAVKVVRYAAVSVVVLVLLAAVLGWALLRRRR